MLVCRKDGLRRKLSECTYKHPENKRIFQLGAEAVQHMMKAHIKMAGVKKIRVHDLRHSPVAYLINQGVKPLVIKERVGHRDIKMTLNTYGHLYPNEQKDVAEMLGISQSYISRIEKKVIKRLKNLSKI